MDDFRLKVFITAARTLSFTRTAEQLCISQPAVSKHVGELESRYRAQLVNRRGSRLELTDAGRTLLDAAERILDDYRRMEYEVSLCTRQTEGELRLGASTTVAQYLLPPILARFTARFPGIRISMLSGNSGQIEHALEEHAIDLGIVESMSRRQGLHYTLFAHDELVLITRTGGKYARTESLTADALRHIPLVLREEGSGTLEVIAAALAAAGIRLPQLHVIMRLGTTEGIKSFVRNSDTMAIVSVISVVDCLRSGVLRIVDWEDLTMRRDFSFVHAETTPAPLAGQIIALARANLCSPQPSTRTSAQAPRPKGGSAAHPEKGPTRADPLADSPRNGTCCGSVHNRRLFRITKNLFRNSIKGAIFAAESKKVIACWKKATGQTPFTASC